MLEMNKSKSAKMNFHSYGFRPAGGAPNRPPLSTSQFHLYPEWKKTMKIFLQAQDIELWKVIVHGPYVVNKKEKEYTNEDWKKVHINSKSMYLLLCSLDLNLQHLLSSLENAQEIWQTLETVHEEHIRTNNEDTQV